MESTEVDSPSEGAIRPVIVRFPSGVRDFLLVTRAEDGVFQAIHPLDLLALDRTARKIQQVGEEQPDLAVVLALCRLLVPCLRYRGSGRHLVVEPWTVSDVRGESIAVDTRTPFARELSAEQAESYRAVTTGEKPPEGSLAELFWASQTALPALPDAFDDPEMGRLANALYFHLVPEGKGMTEVSAKAVALEVESLRATGFAGLNLGCSARLLREKFRRLLAVTVRYVSQLIGQVAEELILSRLRRSVRPKLNARERDLIQFRYGACRALSDINVGFLFGCGPVLADLVNDYFLHTTGLHPDAERNRAEELLRAFVYLLGEFQDRRSLARSQERREGRQRYADRMPHGRRLPAEEKALDQEPAPPRQAELSEKMSMLREVIVPLLNESDAVRLRAYLECGGDRKAAAERLGVEPGKLSRQLRQTIFPAVRKLARKHGLDIGG